MEKTNQKTEGNFHLLTLLKGEVILSGQEKKEILKSGESVLVPATISSYQILSLREEAIILKSFLSP
jgi:mannose-6-phosphate isomerase class I